MSLQRSVSRGVVARVCLRPIGLALSFVGALLIGPAPGGAQPPFAVSIDDFKGTMLGDADTVDSFPPDTMGAMGPNHYVELLNGSFTIYLPNGTPIFRDKDVGFWNEAFETTHQDTPVIGPPPELEIADDPFDPRILYDKTSNRWYAVAADKKRSDDSRILFAVTKGPDPAGLWYGFSIKVDADGERWADFPTLGYSGDAVYIAANLQTVADDALVGQHLIGIPKSLLTAAIPTVTGLRRDDVGLGAGGALQPAVDALGAAKILGLPYKAFFISSTTPGDAYIFEIPDNWISGGAELGFANNHDLTVNLQAPPKAGYMPQQGLEPIDTGDLRLSSGVQLSYDGYWMVVATKDPNTGNAALQWFRFDAKTDEVVETGAITDSAFNFFYPSIAVNQVGQVLIGANAMFAPETMVAPAISGPIPVLHAGVRDPNTNTTTFGVAQLHAAFGVDTYEHIAAAGDPDDPTDDANRWGDYSATTLDPNNLNFWTIQEFPSAVNVWATQISNVAVGPTVGVIALPPPMGGEDGSRGSHDSRDPQDFGSELSLDDIRFSGSFGLSNLPDELNEVGQMKTEEYNLLVDAVLQAGGATFNLHNVIATLQQKFTLTSIDEREQVFDTELLSLDLDVPFLPGLPFDIQLALDPTRASKGQLALTDLGVSGTTVMSYFDLFTQASLDFNGDGVPDARMLTDVGSHFILAAVPVPEPSSRAIFALGAAALLACTWRLTRA